MAEQPASLQGITCPACHFGCKLVKYQCGRGKEFYDIAMAGGEVPERRGPMMTPSEVAARGGDTKPPLNNRVMHTFNIMANVLQKRHFEAGVKKLLATLSRTGGFMSEPILEKRMLVSREELQVVLAEAQRDGFVSVGDDERMVRMVTMTDVGRRQAAVWEQERDERTAEFLSPLSGEEKETLEQLIRKLLSMN